MLFQQLLQHLLTWEVQDAAPQSAVSCRFRLSAPCKHNSCVCSECWLTLQRRHKVRKGSWLARTTAPWPFFSNQLKLLAVAINILYARALARRRQEKDSRSFIPQEKKKKGKKKSIPFFAHFCCELVGQIIKSSPCPANVMMG